MRFPAGFPLASKVGIVKLAQVCINSWSEGPYGRQLLVPDPRVFERLEQKLAEASAPDPAAP